MAVLRHTDGALLNMDPAGTIPTGRSKLGMVSLEVF